MPPRGHRWIAPALFAGTFALYARTGRFSFLHYDDDRYVTDNPVVRAGLSWRGVTWAFTTLDVSNWHPLTWLSHMVDVQLFGLNAGAHHLINAFLHAVNATLLFLVLRRMTGAHWRSAVVAALFAVHPLRVESVAWISERKDLLSSLFGLLMLGAYARCAERPGTWRYVLVVAAFTASLLAKPMWVTAPFLLLLLDVWPLRRVLGWTAAPGAGPAPSAPVSPWRAAAEKLPLVALSLGSAAVTIVAQDRGGSLVGLGLPFATRLQNAVVSYASYLLKSIWPVDLAAFYPYPIGGPSPWQVAGATALLSVLTAFVVWRRRGEPWLIVGWLWFLGTLVPVIGIVQVGMQSMADRYTYLPSMGLLVAAVWSAGELAGQSRWRRQTAVAGAMAAVIVLGAVTFRQIGFWSDQVSLFQHTVAATGPNPRAQLFLAQGLGAEGRFAEAVAHAAESSRLDPLNARAHKNLGYFLYRTGRIDDAIAALERAIALDPSYAEAHGNLAIAYGKKGLLDAAAREMRLERALRARER